MGHSPRDERRLSMGVNMPVRLRKPALYDPKLLNLKLFKNFAVLGLEPLLGASARGVRDRVGTRPNGKGRFASAKPLYRIGKAWFERRPERIDLSSLPRSTGASPKRFRERNRTRSPSPCSPLASFGSVVAVRPNSFLETVLWVFGNRVADRSRGRRWWRTSGEGLGGGYCTPPNRTRRERSELVFGDSWMF